MTEQLRLPLDEEPDPAPHVLDQMRARFPDGCELIVTAYGDGSMTAAKRSQPWHRWGAAVDLVPAP